MGEPCLPHQILIWRNVDRGAKIRLPIDSSRWRRKLTNRQKRGGRKSDERRKKAVDGRRNEVDGDKFQNYSIEHAYRGSSSSKPFRTLLEFSTKRKLDIHNTPHFSITFDDFFHPIIESKE